MVFEAIVVELLNKFLNEYVENLDTSQLKIGIWGGDVVLNDLKIKTTLFDDLNLPVRVKWGKLEKFAMKIPWKNLYGSQVVVNIEELLMVIVPNNEFKYDPIKEEKWAFEKKQAKLKVIEEAKKREIEGDSIKQRDGFVEKLVTQIIKNIQIVIKNIHIRYEDKTTIPTSPFSVGMTLSNLSAQTTTDGDPANHYSKMLQGNDSFIFKVINLEGLSIYWNSSSALFSELPTKDLIKVLVESIPKVNFKPENFMYVFGPLSASAFLRLNPKPELDGSDFTVPKTFVSVHLKEIELAVTHVQFCDVMSFLKDYQRLNQAAKFKMYRPVEECVIGHARKWWMFAYTAVAEDIKRRKKEWSWENIKEHREMCRKYAKLFKQKINIKKLSSIAELELNQLEKKLNVFNLILIREQVYLEAERSNINKSENKPSGWFSGWFGFGTESTIDANDDELVKKIEKVMTTQEKQKLYKAIGYEESAPPTNYPVTFVQTQFWFQLDEIKLNVFDERVGLLTPIMSSSIKTVKMEFEQRPSAFAMKLVMIVGNFQVLGKSEDDVFPELVMSNCSENESLIEMLYETKPLTSSCDHRVNVNARPLRIIYHANTINLVRKVFSTGYSEDVNKIMAVTSASLPTFQKITAMGLQYAIEKRTVLEVKVNIMSSYLIIPYGGVFQPNKEMLVLMLGRLSVETEEPGQKDISVKKLYLEGTTEQEIFSAVLSASYTNFRCHLTGVQILFQLGGEDWVNASNMKETSPLRFLEPTNLVVTIKKSLVTDDARIPKIIIEAKLPSLVFTVSEERFISLAGLVGSVPTTLDDNSQALKRGKSTSAWSLQSIGTQLENKFVQMHRDFPSAKFIEYVQGINLVGHFEMNEFVINVLKSNYSDASEKKITDLKSANTEEKFLTVRFVKMEIELTSKTFENINLLKLGGIEFKQYYEKTILPFVTTKGMENDFYLFIAEYINLDPKVPDFYTGRGAVINRLTLNITPLNVVLNKEALLAQLAFVTRIQRRLDLVKQNCNYKRVADAGKPKEVIYEEAKESVLIDKKMIPKGKRFRKKHLQKEVVDFFLQCTSDEIDVVIEFKGQGVAEFCLKGSSIDISSRKSYTNLDFKLREIILLDLNPLTLHKKIVSSLEEQTLASRITVYNSEYFGSEKSVDMSIEAEVGGIRCTFVNMFFSRAMEFLSAFQSQVETLKEGATVAAQRAKENVMKAYQNATQFCLNIKITAPILLIPKNSKNLETLIIDLGVVSIRNNITELDYSSDCDTINRPIIDTMKLHLQHLKVARCLLNSVSLNPENETMFLVPVSFELTIKRNLSTAWFRVIPELEVLARLAAVHVTLTHKDLCLIATIMQENLNEGSRPVPMDNLSHQHLENKAAKHPGEALQQSHHQVVLHENAQPHNKDEDSNTYTVVKFMFYMDRFVFDAIETTFSALDTSDPSLAENEGLARFVLETISLKGRIFSDHSIHTSIMLISCLLDDTRPGNEGRLTRLMQKTPDSSFHNSKAEANTLNTMIEFIYQKKGCDVIIDGRIYKFTLILSMDFLQKLGTFFTLENNEISAGVDTLENIKTIKTDGKFSKNLKKDEGEKERSPIFTINLRLEKPDIIIVENMDSINTDALIFHTEMVVKYRFSGTRQVISGTFSDIELYSCCFNPSKRPHTLSQVIKPFTISVAGSTPQEQGLHVDVCLTEIEVVINPSTVELISKCYEALLTNTSKDNQNLKEATYLDLWKVKPFNPSNYWFLKPEQGIDALVDLSSSTITDRTEKSNEEICLLAIPSITISLEGSGTNQNKPLLLLQMGFHLQCHNWTSEMNINSSLTVLLQYYNKGLLAWEPLLEPVEKVSEKDNKCSYDPWELSCSVVLNEVVNSDNFESSKIYIDLACSEVLQLTMTKTCIEVLKNVADTYSSAVTKKVLKKIIDLPPYVIKNETGLVVELLLSESYLQVCKTVGSDYKIVKLESNSEVELESICEDIPKLNKPVGRNETRLHIRFPNCAKTVIELPLEINSVRYFPIPLEEFSKDEVWGLISDVSIMDNSTTVVLRSVLRIINFFTEPINIHSLSEDEKEVEYVGTVEGNSTFSLPFRAVYSSKKELFFSVIGYSLSIQSFVWENMVKELDMSILLQCNSKTPENNDPFFMQAVGEAEQVLFANTNRKTMSSFCYKIHLQPTVKILNALPVGLVVCFQGSAKEKFLHSGNNLQVTNAEPGVSSITLRINDYLEKEWSCKETILENPPEFFVWKFVSYNGLAPETLNLGIHCTYKRKTAVYTIYCPYFMVNKTEHLLSYKFEGSSSVFYHPGDFKSPVMFSPSYKKFFGKKSAFLQVDQSEWSDKFSVDVAGSGGTVECIDSETNVTYKVSVMISLTYNSLTRIIVFTPFYVLVNACKYTIECKESEFLESSWLEIPAESCLPFWPRSQSKGRTLQVKPKGSNSVSAPFGYESTDSCLLRLAHKCGGIFLNVQATQSGTYLTFDSYEPGQAPALIINHSAKVINFSEENTEFRESLNPFEQVMYSWTCPTGDRKLIFLNSLDTKNVIQLEQDSEGFILTDKGEGVRYLSFLDGSQRILLFTEDTGLSSSICSSLKVTASGVELICKIQGIGISLVNNANLVEIIYIGFVSSGISWELRKPGKTRYKSLKREDAHKLEAAYNNFLRDSDLKTDLNPVVKVTDKMKVDFSKMEVIEPQNKKLKRTFESGFWFVYKTMEDQIMLHIKINRIQIDNQLHDCIFPVILSPVPPPKSVASMYKGSKPFFEMSVVKIAGDKSGVQQYKYFKILVQEFQVKIDIGVLQQLWAYLTPEEISDEDEKIYFRKDVESTQKPLMSHVEVVSSNEQKNFYDLLHFSPLKIHFSFSLAGNIDSGSLPPSFSVMLQSLGVTLTDVHDVIFRLSYFERKCNFLTNSQLRSEVISHYYGQTVRQAYVLLLGLDVIGNPYGLITGIGEGVEAFFYEPFQGIIQGPSDFATGVAIGCKSLLGRTVGSTAGTLGKLTETLGKGLAVLSLDKEYQMQRMENQNRQDNIQASMARGGRGLVMGVYEGVTGIVKKPLEGAKEGVGGFFKGVGKGMMGLVTRPVTGVVDFASTSLNAVKRVAEPSVDNKRLRPPRFFRHDSVVQPYYLHDAKGNALLYAICKRKYCNTDKYEFHAELKGKEVVVLTNKRIILAEFNDVFGSWQEHLTITWISMVDRPSSHVKGVALFLSPKSVSLKKEKPDIKVLLVEDLQLKETLHKKMVELYLLEKEQ